jgi:nucleotidyltransferase/DNA polymerase involved in DNA repair
VRPDEVLSFLEELPIRKFYGVGKVTTEKMYQLGIFTGVELKSKSLDFRETFWEIRLQCCKRNSQQLGKIKPNYQISSR